MRTWFSDLKNIFFGNYLYSQDLQTTLSEEIDIWRDKIFVNGLRFVFIFSSIAVISSIISLYHNNKISLVFVEVFSFVSIIILVFVNKIPIYLKKILLAVLIYFVGLSNILLLGNPGSGYYYLFLAPIYAGFFFGYKGTLYNLLAVFSTLILLVIGSKLDFFPYSISPNIYSDSLIVFFIDFFFLCSIISISLFHLFRKLNITLNKEDRVKKLLEIEQKRLYNAKEKAEVADSLKSAFLANMSHEIRTPLNGILGFAELMKDDRIDKAEKKEYVNIIINNGKQLLHLINDIIDVSKIESKQLVVKPVRFEPDDLLDELFSFFENHKKNIDKGNVELILSTTNTNKQVEIFTDKIRLNQVMSNLLDNALKFTETGSIEFGYSFLNDNTIEFFVEDTGIGISETNQKIIFERFRQAEVGTKRAMHGTGLGLSICKALVELMGGEIHLKSEKDKGSRFSFILPLDYFSESSDKEGNQAKTILDLGV